MAKRSGKLRNLQQGNAIAGYLFIAPFIIGFVFFEIYPLIQSLYLSFCTVKVAPGGFETTLIKDFQSTNYYKAFAIDGQFNRLLVDELKNMAINVPVTLIFAFFIALILNQEFKGRGFVRAIFFLPVILSSGVMVGLEYNNSLLNGLQDVIRESSNSTSVTQTLEEILTVSSGIGRDALDIVFDAINRVYDIAMASGIQIIVFLSGLQTITTSMFEAAKIEGATAWETFWKITFPMISSLILVNLIYTVIDCFLNSNSQLMNKITTTMSRDLDYGFSSAMAWVYMLVVVAVVGILSWIISKRVYYYD